MLIIAEREYIGRSRIYGFISLMASGCYPLPSGAHGGRHPADLKNVCREHNRTRSDAAAFGALQTAKLTAAKLTAASR